MQKKFSYGVLKWTLLLGVSASLATACVVTSGDGSDLSDGGEGNDTTDGGEPSTSGGSGTAGKGGSSTTTAGTGGTSAAGTSAGGENTGGSSPTYVPGKCEADLATPSMLPSCSEAKTDENACRDCLRAKACDAWQTCYGTEPTTACGFGPKAGDGGQFGCILTCFFDNKDGETDEMALFLSCGDSCSLQCSDADSGVITDATNTLAGEAFDVCKDECFPPIQ